MSIIINVYYTGKNGSAKKFADEMIQRGIVNKIRSQQGNEKYEYFIPINDSETVLLIDKWADNAALDRHHASPMMSQIVALRDKYELHMTVERYLSDDNGVSAGDEAFIRR